MDKLHYDHIALVVTLSMLMRLLNCRFIITIIIIIIIIIILPSVVKIPRVKAK